jgi:transposase-like protein
LKHKSENILDAVPKEDQDYLYKKLAKIFYGATSLEQSKLFIREFKKEFTNKYPTAVERLERDLEQCLTFYLFPANHWKRIRTSNKLERLNRELRRRLDVIGRHPDELGCLALIHQVAKKYSNLRLEFNASELVLKLWQRLKDDKISILQQLGLDFYQATA